MKELIGVYTAEMARKDYEESNIIIKNSNEIISLIEERIKNAAKSGKAKIFCEFIGVGSGFKKYIHYISKYLKENGYVFGIFSDKSATDFAVIVKWG